MLLSDVSVKRPVLASVLSLLLLAFGLVAFDRLPLREYPDIDPPVVSIETTYPGASAAVVESRITEVIEERIAGVEGIEFIESVSEDGESNITIEFAVGRDVEAAANDIRDRVSRIADNLPVEADPPEIQKVDANDDVIMWLNLAGEGMTVPELTDYAERYLVDRFSVLDGVARVRVGGGQSYAMRVWLDRKALAARGLTVNDIEQALRQQNVELPAGSVESETRQFTVRVERAFRSVDDFAGLVIGRGSNGYLVRLADVARVELGVEELRTFFRGNGVPMVGIGIVRQSTANIIDVARAAKAEMDEVNRILPDGIALRQSYDTSVFVENAISEVYKTLGIAIVLVVLVIYLFLGSMRAMLVPAVTVPVSIVATFLVLYALGFSVNLFTLLALVLAIGLVVDDAIVVLENIVRRMHEYGEPPLLAAYRGARQVGFAVIATTLVLIAVFVPIAFLQGDVGRLFSEFALTMAAAVGFSSLVALTLSPMLASKVLNRESDDSAAVRLVDATFSRLQRRYAAVLAWCLAHLKLVAGGFLLVLALAWAIFQWVPSEYAPREDRGAFFVLVNGPEGASYQYMEDYMDEIERRMMPYVDNGEITRLLVRAPRAFGNLSSFNSGIVICVLSDWSERRSGFAIMDNIRADLSDLPGVRAFPVMRQGFGSSIQKPVQFVIGGGTYEELAQWRDTLASRITEENPNLLGVDFDYKETKPQLDIFIDYQRAADLGVSVENIGRTLETMLGSRRITTFLDRGEEYDVIVEGERDMQRSPDSVENIYVRASSGTLVPLSNLVTIKAVAAPKTLNRYNRVRALTLEANLADGYSLGEALGYLEGLVREELPDTAVVDYKGQSRDFRLGSSSLLFVFLLGLMVTYLVLAAQFESFVHPFVIMLTVPLALAGGVLGLLVTGNSLNLYSQIGLIMLIGLAAKNGILIVEFANQLRARGRSFEDALQEAARVRLRPVLMTAITTAAGAVPLLVSFGAGAETRQVLGVVIVFGIVVATLFTMLVVPAAYALLTRNTRDPDAVTRDLEEQDRGHPEGGGNTTS
jgi:multidrug efflux pump